MTDLIHGITVELLVKTEAGKDQFNIQQYTETWEPVENVVVYPSSTQEITDTVTLYGKYAQFTLCIPKDDDHKWTDTKVKFWGQTWRTIGPPKRFIDDMVPLSWNKIVMVESDGLTE